MKMILLFFAVLVVLVLSTAASASSGSMRCKGEIIEAGTYKAEVIAKCGPPTQAIDTRLIYIEGNVVHIVHIMEDKVSMIEMERQ